MNNQLENERYFNFEECRAEYLRESIVNNLLNIKDIIDNNFSDHEFLINGVEGYNIFSADALENELHRVDYYINHIESIYVRTHIGFIIEECVNNLVRLRDVVDELTNNAIENCSSRNDINV